MELDQDHGFSEEQLREMAAELMSCSATAIHALCSEKMEEKDIDALVVQCALFVACSMGVETMTKEQFVRFATIGFDEMALMKGGAEWKTTSMQ